jgi:hypothetical protein
MDPQMQQTAESSTGSTQPVTGNGAQEPHGSPRRRWPYVVAALSLVVLLVGAAFVGGRLLARRRTPSGVQVVELGDGGIMVSMEEGDIQQPDELPKELPTTQGDITRIEGKTITVGQPKSEGEGGVVYNSGEEPEYEDMEEVVVTQETLIYRGKPVEIKPDQESGRLPPMEVEEIGLADLKKGDFVQVWGEKRGDRVVAEVIYLPASVVVRAG